MTKQNYFFEVGKLYRITNTTLWSFSKDFVSSKEPTGIGPHHTAMAAYKGDTLLVTEHVKSVGKKVKRMGGDCLDHHYNGLLLSEGMELRGERAMKKTGEVLAVEVSFVFVEALTEDSDDWEYWGSKLERVARK